MVQRSTAASGTSYLRNLLLSFAGVALCFVLSTTLAERRASAIDAEVLELTGNGLPSIDELAAAIQALHRMEVAIEQQAASEPSLRATLRTDIARDRRAVDTHVATYLQTPMFPGEQARYDDLAQALRDLDQALARLSASPPDSPAIAASVASDVRPRMERANATLGALFASNLTGSRVAARSIDGIRGGSAKIALGLDALGVVLAIVAALSARTAFRRYASLADENTELLSRRAQDLELFAQHIAHDLVSPLSALSIRLDRIQRSGREVPGIEDSVKQAKACVLRATRMTRGIFELARSGQPLAKATTEMAAIVRGVADDVKAAADPLEPKIEIDVDPELSVACAPGVLTSVVLNLLDNAVKHGQVGSDVDIEVVAKPKGDAVRLEVRDHGPGVPPGAEDQVFEAYTRLPGTTAPGLGVGLATVRRLVEGHGGIAGVTPTDGGGATFFVELPRVLGLSSIPAGSRRSRARRSAATAVRDERRPPTGLGERPRPWGALGSGAGSLARCGCSNRLAWALA
jgi:signal transduction histidine kinase